eukprot:TRINITY_DN0_c33_g1_i1.p1 TRINITY_DN0_c33_g1~~TRINITY_DN0_c33_g1_i1.p1  ORF type:complete len:242 (-),score=57.17 TRINITY_DN0_c33_g1_i1:40-765(-)
MCIRDRCKGLDDATGCTLFSTNSGCKECAADYYAGSDAYKCDKCMNGCTDCDTLAVCKNCNTTTHRKVGDVCIAKGTAICPEGTYNDTNGVCQECPDGCQDCTAADTCGTCFPGYTKPAGSANCATFTSTTGVCETGQFSGTTGCEACHGTCKRCTGSNLENACTHCKLGTFLGTGTNAGKCMTCKDGSNCGSCLDGDDCTSCPSGYKFNAAGTACESTGSGFGGYIFSGAAVLISLLTLI